MPYPLFPPFVLLGDHQGLERPINNDVRTRLDTLDPELKAFQTWRFGIDFLTKQCQRPQFTPRHYKMVCPVLETMMHWSWSIRHKSIPEWQETDAREFMHFVMRLPMSWISKTGGTRYLLGKAVFAVKPINDNWRPIVRKQLAGDSVPTDSIPSSASIPESRSDFALGTDQHRQVFMHGGRDFFRLSRYRSDYNDTESVRWSKTDRLRGSPEENTDEFYAGPAGRSDVDGSIPGRAR